MQAVAILHTPSVGELLALWGDIGGLGAVPLAGPGQSPWSEGLGAKPRRSWKLFVSQFFFLRHAQRSNALTEFDAWWLKMRGITQGCAFLGLKIKLLNVVLATGRQTTIKIIKIKQFYC